MRAYVSGKPVDTEAGSIPVTIGIGLATQHVPGPATGQELVRAADRALYMAKANGRNRVERAPEYTTGPARAGVAQ